NMNRLWSIESVFTNTGAMADHRLALRSELGLPFVLALEEVLGGGSPTGELFREAKVVKFVKVLAAELTKNKGKSILIARRRQQPEVHAVVARINQTLNAPGNTLDYVEDPDGDRKPHVEAIQEVARAMASGQIGTFLMIGGNPVYDAPADLDFAKALAAV